MSLNSQGIYKILDSPWVAVLLSIPFFIGLGLVHLFDWDEINFAECSREMIESGQYLYVQINYQPFWEKPPLFFWIQSSLFKLLGQNEYAARLPNAVVGLISLVFLYKIGNELTGRRFARIWVVIYAGSLLPHLYFKSGILDPLFNLLIFASVYYVFKGLRNKQSFAFALLAGIASGLAFLTKGPVGFLLLVLTLLVFNAFNRFSYLPNGRQFIGFAFGFIIMAALWLVPSMIYNGTDILRKFVVYQWELFSQPVAGHKQPFYYHFVVVLIGCFPLSILALPMFKKNASRLFYTDESRLFFKMMMSLFWVVMILFSIVSTKIVHYSSMAYFPLSFIAASSVQYAAKSLGSWNRYVLLIIGLLLGIAVTCLPIFALNPEIITPYINDPFAVDSLTTPAGWNGFESLIGIGFIVFVVMAFVVGKKSVERSILLYCTSVVILLLSVQLWMVEKIEKFSQGPAIEFYQKHQGELVVPFGFKSYAHYFYGQSTPEFSPYIKMKSELPWKDVPDVIHPIYLVTKSTNNRLDTCESVDFLHKTGGFKFYQKHR